MTANCVGQAPQGAGCVAACKAQSTWDLTCRNTHCGYAAGGNQVPHCGHAGGVSVCP